VGQFSLEETSTGHFIQPASQRAWLNYFNYHSMIIYGFTQIMKLD